MFFRNEEGTLEKIFELLKALKRQGDHQMTTLQDMQSELSALDSFVAALPGALEAMIAANAASDDAAFAAAAAKIKADLAAATAAVNPAPAASAPAAS